jgi:hypothetical protein
MKSSLIGIRFAILGLVISVGAIAGLVVMTSAQAGSRNDIVGSWSVQAINAPYPPHLFTFSADGNMFTTNPTNVQEDPAKPHGGTNDSVGMGTWRKEGKFIFGTFYQLNAFADDHTATDTLEVRFRIQVNGDKFTGDWLIAAFDARGTFTADRLQLKK